MNTKHYVLIGIAVVLAALVGSLTGGETTIVEKILPGSSNNVGALTGPDIPYPFFGVGGVREHKASITLKTATTTVCAIQSPVATSTLKFAGVRFATASTTASTVTLAKAATAYATTTSLGSAVIAANAQGTVLASTSPTTSLDDSVVFAPSQWFVVGMAGNIGTFSPTGTCQATWEAF
jgi:hypothetical protein